MQLYEGKDMDGLSITELVGKNLFCILKHILDIREYWPIFHILE